MSLYTSPESSGIGVTSCVALIRHLGVPGTLGSPVRVFYAIYLLVFRGAGVRVSEGYKVLIIAHVGTVKFLGLRQRHHRLRLRDFPRFCFGLREPDFVAGRRAGSQAPTLTVRGWRDCT